MMDVLLLLIALKPDCDDNVEYHGRKFHYLLIVNILKEDMRKIRPYFAGYPGSIHDKRVWKNM
jgi:hypothetical protein